MMLAKGTIVAVADGTRLNLFRNSGDEAGMKLTALPHHIVDKEAGTSGGHQSSSGNPDRAQAAEQPAVAPRARGSLATLRATRDVLAPLGGHGPPSLHPRLTAAPGWLADLCTK